MPPFKLKKRIKNSYCQGPSLIADTNLISMFVKHAKNSPKQIAIQTSDSSWTYKKLYEDVIAWKNRIRSIEIDGPVIICLHRTPRLISVLLALQWLKIPYIPVELTTPVERIRAIIEDSKAKFIFHDTINHEIFTTLACSVYSLQDLEKTDTSINEKDIDSKLTANVISYVIYTSGSTGTPKGVSISEIALSNFLTSISQFFLKEDNCMALATTTIAFDIAALELYLPIWQKKPLFLASQAEHKDPLLIQDIMKNYPITFLQGTPSFWKLLNYSGWEGKKDLVALCGGEALTPKVAQNMLTKVQSLWNMYGPTEATIWCSLKKIKVTKNITIGSPIHNMKMLILDTNMQITPIGKKGELYIGGPGLADGYINHEKLTKGKFIFYKNKNINERLYKTGDIACMTETDEFIIFGRVDNQVKLHGYRIELEDIEAHIQASPGVRECVVGVYDEQLVAYICTIKNSCYDEKKLLNKLEQEIPKFMIPNRFIYLDNLPLNTSGKINRNALPKPDSETHQASINTTPIQKSLINIWREILDVANMSINDNFFELGGHSLLAARIVAKIRTIHNKEIKLHDIYHYPTIEELADLVISAPDTSINVINTEKEQVSAWMPLTDFQFVLWISYLFKPAVKKLNIVDRRRILGPLNLDALNLALEDVIKKHDVFSYKFNLFFPIQKRKGYKKIRWQEISLTKLDQEKTERYLNQSIKKLAIQTSWPNNKPLLIAKLFHLNNDQIEIQICMPHLISDQKSLDLFFQHLSHTYLFYARNTKTEILLDTKPFETYARHEYNCIKSSLQTAEKFWQNYLKDTNLFPFPKQYIVSNKKQKKLSFSSFFQLSEEKLNLWKKFCIKNSVTINDLLCAAIGSVLFNSCKDKITLPKNIFINTVKSSREDPAYDRVIGCFLKTQPIKLNITEKKNLQTLAKEVQQSLIETSAHQYSSNLIKLSSVGDLELSKNKIKSCLINLISKFYCKISKQPHNLNLPILNACQRLAAIKHDHRFVININIQDSFFLSTKETHTQLFGSSCQPIPIVEQEHDIFTIDGVLDICLLKDHIKNQSFLVISANLQRDFREQLGKMLIDIL